MRKTVHLHVITCVTFLLLKCARSDVEGFFQTSMHQSENYTQVINTCEHAPGDNPLSDLPAKHMECDILSWHQNFLEPVDKSDVRYFPLKVRKLVDVVQFRRDEPLRRRTESTRREKSRNVYTSIRTQDDRRASDTNVLRVMAAENTRRIENRERSTTDTNVRRTIETENTRRLERRKRVHSVDSNRRRERVRNEILERRVREDQRNDRRRDNRIATRDQSIVRSTDIRRSQDTRRNERSTRNDRNNLLSERQIVHRFTKRETLRVREENEIRSNTIQRREMDVRSNEDKATRRQESLSARQRSTELNRRDTFVRRFTDLENRKTSDSVDTVVQSRFERKDSYREKDIKRSSERSRSRSSETERTVDNQARNRRERDQVRMPRNIDHDFNSERRRSERTLGNNENRRTMEKDTTDARISQRLEQRKNDKRREMIKMRDTLTRGLQFRHANNNGKDTNRREQTRERRTRVFDERRVLTLRRDNEHTRRRQNDNQSNHDDERRRDYQNNRRREDSRIQKLPEMSDVRSIYSGLQKLNRRDRFYSEDSRNNRLGTIEDSTRTRRIDDGYRTNKMTAMVPGYQVFLDQGGITRAIVIGFIGILGRGLWQKQI